MDISSLRDRVFTEPISVSELNGYIKRIFESDRQLTAISIRGEISNLVYHRSGHLYFSLKDPDGQIRAVMFHSAASRLKFQLENGMKVVARGSVSIYVRDGSYQIYVNSVEPDGIGGLYLAYEQLKAKLESEGIFEEYNKKPIPEFAFKIGVITSPTGAAVRDIINVSRRRFPGIKIYIYPALVQGEGAEESLLKALDYFEKSKLVDLIIIGRGGGSIEDLWAFNSEKLARKIFAAATPIISAVGHETDFTICDFVSDLRAPTPSAAAELAVPDVKAYLRHIDNFYERATNALSQIVSKKREVMNSLVSKSVLATPYIILEKRRQDVEKIFEDIKNSFVTNLSNKKNVLAILSEKSNALSPLSVLSRGYSIAEINGKTLKSVKDIKENQEFSLTLSDGVALAVVEKIKFGR